MAFSAKLADLFVQFTASGVEHLAAQFKSIQTGLANVGDAANKMGNVVNATIGRATTTITNFAKAGIMASAWGEILAFKLSLLSREVAGIFIPVVQQAIATLDKLTGWFRSLSGQQQDVILKWVMAAAAMSAALVVIPQITTALSALVGVMKLATTFTAGLVRAIGSLATGAGIIGAIGSALGPIVAILPLLIAGFVALGVAGTAAEGGLKGLLEVFQPIIDAIGVMLDTLRPAFDQLAAISHEAFGEFAKAIAQIMPQITLFVEKFAEAAETYMPAWVELMNALVQIFGDLLEAMAPLIPQIAEIAGSLVKILIPALHIVAEALKIVIALMEPMVRAFVTIARVIAQYIAPVLEWFGKGLKEVETRINELTGKQVKLAIETTGPKFKDLHGGAHRTALPRLGGIEDVQAAYERISLLSRLVGSGQKTKEDEQIDWLTQISTNTLTTSQGISKLLPAVK